jgi:hypothetical protein
MTTAAKDCGQSVAPDQPQFCVECRHAVTRGGAFCSEACEVAFLRAAVPACASTDPIFHPERSRRHGK